MNIPVTEPPEANAKFAREAWIRALERTASIDRLGVTLPALIGRPGARIRCGARARVDRSHLELSGARDPLQSVLALGTRAGPASRGHRRLDDAELRRIHGNLAGSYAHRRRCRPDQQQSGGRRVVHSISIVAPRAVIVAATCIAVGGCARTPGVGSVLLGVRRRHSRSRTSGACTRSIVGRRIAGFGVHAAAARCHRALYSTHRAPPVCPRQPRSATTA